MEKKEGVKKQKSIKEIVFGFSENLTGVDLLRKKLFMAKGDAAWRWELSDLTDKLSLKLDYARDPDEKLEEALSIIKKKYNDTIKKAIEDDLNPSDDGWLLYRKLTITLGRIVAEFKIGNVKEVLDAFLIFGEKERKRPESRFYNNAGDFILYFIDHNYFPNDPALRDFARDLILVLLSVEKYKEKNKKMALDYLDILMKKGVLNEEKDADLIEMATR